MNNIIHATTVLCVKRDNTICMASDGQVSQGNSIVKTTAKKVRIYKNIAVGFAGNVSDCIILLDKLEKKIEEFSFDAKRACYELIKSWRTDKYTRDFNASIIVASKQDLLILDGSGTIIEPDSNIASIGSGSLYAQSAAHALYKHTTLSAQEIVSSAMNIAADICIYTNHNYSIITI